MSWKALAWVIEQQDIRGTDKHVLLMLAYRDNEDPPHGCFPSLKRIARDCGLNKDTIINAIKRLESTGKIRVSKRKTSSGDTTSNFYEIIGFREPLADDVVLEDGGGPAEWVVPETDRGQVPQDDQGVVPQTDSNSNALTATDEELPLPKPKKRVKTKKEFKRHIRSLQRPSRSLNDFPEAPRIGRVVEFKDATVSRVVPNRSIRELQASMNKEFKKRIGKSMGVGTETSGEIFIGAYEAHGEETLWKAFECWLTSEGNLLEKFEFNYWGRFTKNIEIWIADVGTEKEEPKAADPNAGLALSEKGRKILEQYK